jgi:hypothetical protein
MDAVPRGKRINSGAYVRTLTEIRMIFKGDRSHKNPTDVLLQRTYTRLGKS